MEDGYAVGDPYAQAAKMIDRKHGSGAESSGENGEKGAGDAAAGKGCGGSGTK